MTAPKPQLACGPVIEAAVLRIDTEARPPVAQLVCHRCGHDRTVRGRDSVRDFVRSRPLHDHRINCPATTAQMGHAA